MPTDASDPRPQPHDGDRFVTGLLPLRAQIVFPGQRARIEVARPLSVGLVEALDQDGARDRDAHDEFVVFTQHELATEHPHHDDLHLLGTRVRVLGKRRYEGLGFVLDVEGLHRVRRLAFLSGPGFDEDYLRCECERIVETGGDPRPAAELRREAAEVLPELERELAEAGPVAATPHLLVDRVAAELPLAHEERLELFEQVDVDARIARARELVAREHDRLRARAELQLPSVETMDQLWPLRDDGGERIERMAASGEITPDEARALDNFRTKGYVRWPGLIEPELADRFLDDVAHIRDHAGRYLVSDLRRARRLRPSDHDVGTEETVFDPYVNLPSARRIALHPTIVRFLELLFEEPPLIVRQDLHQRSPDLPLHQDSSRVRLREPVLMATSWIALSDVPENSGEPVHYEASHRIPHYLFSDGSKHFDPTRDDTRTTRDELLRRCEAADCREQRLLANKGDVFLRAADLVHGNMPRPDADTARYTACVTHYAPLSNQPLWFFDSPDHATTERVTDRAPEDGPAITSAHYRLALRAGRTETMLTPTPPGPEPC